MWTYIEEATYVMSSSSPRALLHIYRRLNTKLVCQENSCLITLYLRYENVQRDQSKLFYLKVYQPSYGTLLTKGMGQYLT